MDESTATVAAASMGAAMVFFMLIYLAIAILMLISYWKIFTKAGRQGWEAIIPIYNVFIFLKIIQKSAWWFLLFCIPLVNIVFGIMAINELSKRFGKDTGFTIGLLFLPVIFIPILAFGDSKYTPEVQ